MRLIYTIRCLLIETIRSDGFLPNQLKWTSENKKSDLINILNHLSKFEKREHVQLKTY